MNTRRTKGAVAVVGTVLTLSVVSFVAYPLVQGIVQDYGALQAAKIETASIAADLANITAFKETARVYEAEFGRFESLLVNPDIPIPFIKFMEEAAATSQLELLITPQDPIRVEGDPWDSMEFHLSLEGQYPDFLTFLATMESAPYLLEVANVSVRRLVGQQDGSPVTTGEFTIILKVFVQ